MPSKPKTAKQLGEEILAERAMKRKQRIPGNNKSAHKRKVKGQKTRIAMDVREGKRKPPPVPDVSLEVIEEMDPDDQAFKHPQGRPRKYEDKDNKDLSWKESIKKERQAKKNAQRARVRKREAEIVKTEERRRLQRIEKPVRPGANLEEQMYADGLLDMDDWDNEELIRGYRRQRDGKFGKPPKYIPHELQQECIRRLVKRGRRNLEAAYVQATERLVILAQTAESEKIQLEATKEVLDRVAGKVPEHLKVSPEAPYESFLADALIPLEEITETTRASQKETEWELEWGHDELEEGKPELTRGNDVIEAEVVESKPRKPKRKAS